ncbi:MAG TPA: hypothetical protein PKA19_05800 [Bacillota bacterium]|nr:hypothetical protein [Bacillota bacterium]
MTDRELLELIATKVGGLETKVDSIETRMDGMETKMDRIETRMDSMGAKVDSMGTRLDKVEKSTARMELMIENDLKPKIEVLFDGYVQHGEQLARIEKEVSRQEEFILRKVK